MGKFAANSEPLAPEARMECNMVSVLEGDSRWVVNVVGDVASHSWHNVFVEFVGLNIKRSDYQEETVGSGLLTNVLGLAEDFAEGFDKVREIATEEFGPHDDVLSGQTRDERSSKQLGLSLQAQCRAPCGALASN